MARAATKPAPAPTAPVDPLADLREDEDTPLEGSQPGQDAQEGPGRALASQDDHDTARAEIVAAWHADTTAHGFVHRGGQCGCRYLADLALRTAFPIQANDADDAPEDE